MVSFPMISYRLCPPPGCRLAAMAAKILMFVMILSTANGNDQRNLLQVATTAPVDPVGAAGIAGATPLAPIPPAAGVTPAPVAPAAPTPLPPIAPAAAATAAPVAPPTVPVAPPTVPVAPAAPVPPPTVPVAPAAPVPPPVAPPLAPIAPVAGATAVPTAPAGFAAVPPGTVAPVAPLPPVTPAAGTPVAAVAPATVLPGATPVAPVAAVGPAVVAQPTLPGAILPGVATPTTPTAAPAIPGAVAGAPAAAPLPGATPVLPGAAPVPPVGAAPAVAPAAPAVPAAVPPGAAAPVAVVDDALGGAVASPIAPAPGPAAAGDAAVDTADGGAEDDFDGDVTSADGGEAAPAASNGVPRNRLPQLSIGNLTAPDLFVYDFKVTDEDYIPPQAPLTFNGIDLRNMTSLPPLPASVTFNPPEAPSQLLTWRLDILNHNRDLWRSNANRKIEDAVTTLVEQADIYMRDPVYEATNKSVNAPAQGGNVTSLDLTRVYFSLSDYYWPHRVSSVNPNGLPYKYNPSVNLQVYELTPNKRHLELTIEHASTLTLAWFFSGSARYAQRARDKIFTWFLDPAISMYPDLRVAGVHRGGTKFGRPEGIFDMARLADLLNAAVMLEGAEGIWSADDTRAMQSWVFQYVDFLKTEPVAVYARMMGNYIGTNVDEQLLAANLYLSAAPDTQAESRTEAEKIAYYSEARQRDQIVDGVLVYERNRQRSLDFSQQCLQSWVNIAIMAERVGVNIWTRGLNEGYSIKDAFDASRPYFESLGESWPFDQVGTPRVRVAAQLVPPLYVGFRLAGRADSGPYEYIPLYTELWPTFNTAGSQARGIIERLPHIELDSQFADEGVPLINECDSLSCDTRTLSIWGVTALLLCAVGFCLCWNCFIHWRADRATEVPKFLQNIREQQAKYKQMNLRVTPAKPDYMIARRAREAQKKVEEKLAKEEERKDRELKQKIKHYEDKLQRRRESKFQSQMQSQYSHMPYGSMMPSYAAPGSIMPPMAPSHYSASIATPSVAGGGSSFYHDQGFAETPMSRPGYGQQSAPYAPGWPGANVHAQAIPEEIPEGGASGATPAGGDFSFPAADAYNAGAVDSVRTVPGDRGNPVEEGGPLEPQSQGMSGVVSPRSGVTGVTHPSQSLTGILAGAHELLGEIGTSTTQGLTGTFTGTTPRTTVGGGGLSGVAGERPSQEHGRQ